MSIQSEFRENELSDCHTLLKSIKEFLFLFPSLFTDLDETRYRQRK
jgi:hypothetical protein